MPSGKTICKKKEKKTVVKKNILQKGQNGQFFGTAMLHFKELITI